MKRPSADLCKLAVAAFFMLAPWAAGAQEYPSKPVRVIVPFPPGGYTDVVARIVAQGLSDKFGQTFTVDNRPGAGTVIGAEAVARAQPDGYTLMVAGSSTFTINPVLIHNLPYDPVKSFAPVGVVAYTPMMLLANPSFPAGSVKELVALAGPSPGKYAYGSFGSGTISQFAGEAFAAAVGIRLLHVPYKGSAFVMNDLVAGQLPLSFDTLVVAAPQMRAGKIKALAVLTRERNRLFPALPTVAESGYPGFDIGTWIALTAPAGTPEAVMRKLRSEVSAIVTQKANIERMEGLGVDAIKPNAEDFTRYMQGDIARYTKIAAEANIKAE